MFELRPYQIEALEKIDSELKIKLNVLFVAIMGAGKTITICRLINTYYKETNKRFLILVNKQELVNQFRGDLIKRTDIPDHEISVCCAGLNSKYVDGRVVVATVQSFIGMMEEYGSCDLLVLDEVHAVSSSGQYADVVNHLRTKNEHMRILGCTATPYRLGHGMIYGNACVNPDLNLFSDISHKITYRQLLSQGYLVPLHGKVAHAESLGNDLSTVEVNGDYVLSQAGEVMCREIHLSTALQGIKEHCQPFRSVCVFCCTIDHAERLMGIINQVEPCTTIHSQLTAIERYTNMEAWKSGKIRVCTSVNILAEGFDHPPLDCLVFARPTLSARLFVQAIGRVLRTSEGKKSGFLLDLTCNTSRFGVSIDDIKADVPQRVIDGKKKDQEMFKFCPQCFVEVHQTLRVCDACGYEWPAPVVVEATEVPEMKDVIFGVNELRTVHPTDIWCSVHESKGGKVLGKCSFICDEFRFLSVWFCMEDYYQGYAVTAGKKRWKEMGGFDPYPESVDEFNQRATAELVLPKAVMVDESGRWPEVKTIVAGTDEAVPDPYVDDGDGIPF